ncbi:hypothetical protein K438DRAFT_1804874 [Mycena galopus ATCC 62051]|nr:hypothetical protein K438DRAFT_1804874 [Mycena galopus ATCC 62051]
MEALVPLDVEREIFETAAMQHPTLIPTLLRVCHRVHTWIEPVLYRVLVLSNLKATCLPAARSKSPTFLKSAVRHVLFSASAAETIKDALRECTGIISLFIDGELNFNTLPFVEKMRPRKLDLSVPEANDAAAQWAKSMLMHSLFLSVTHLELYRDPSRHPGVQGDDQHWKDSWSLLATLPALTHLCLSLDLSRQILRPALAECPRLSVGITAFWSSYNTDIGDASEFAQEVSTIIDPRIVVMVVDDYEEDWKTGACGGKDFWERAEEFVVRKLKGEIEKTCHLLDDHATTS